VFPGHPIIGRNKRGKGEAMLSIIQILSSGISMGFIYCLIAIEYTLIWNACGVINFAHEKFIVLGAFFFAGTMIKVFGLPLLPAALFTFLFMFGFGILVAVSIINPMRNMPSGIFTIIGMLMLAYVIRESVRLIFGVFPLRVDNFFSGTVKFGPTVVLPKVYLFIILISGILLVIQALFFTRTKLGKSMLCVAQDKEAAAIMGINVQANIALTVAISAGICGLIGMMVIPLFSVDHAMASTIAQKGFAAGVVGGFGTYFGAVVGGIFIGLVEAVYLIFGPAIYKDVIAFLLLIIFLLVKPSGIMGTGTNPLKFILSSFKKKDVRNEVK
jgi:branched-chain amino acid transport system permease protein